MEPLLQLKEVSLVRGSRQVLDRVSLNLAASERLVVMGPSGVGKTSLLYIIAGLLREATGTVMSRGSLLQGGGQFVRPADRGFGFVFHGGGLFPHLTVRENLALKRPSVSEAWAKRLERELMVSTLFDHRPNQLSAGQAQRVGLLRTLLLAPRLILMDEVFATLDGSMRRAVRGLVVEFLTEHEIAAVIVTHDEREASEVASRVALLEGGRLIQDSGFDDAYRTPASFESGWLLGPLSRWPVGSGGQLLRPEKLRVSPRSSEKAILHGTVRTCEAQADHYIIQVRPEVPASYQQTESETSVYGIAQTRLAPGCAVFVELAPDSQSESSQE